MDTSETQTRVSPPPSFACARGGKRRWLDENDCDYPRLFDWTRTADEILGSAARCRLRISNSEHKQYIDKNSGDLPEIRNSKWYNRK
jgi:hypothetical protein